MSNRELLLAAVDLLFALLIVFVIGFFAVRYDESRGSQPHLISLDALESSAHGDYSSLKFLGVFLYEDYLYLRPYNHGVWGDFGPMIRWDWQEILAYELPRNDLPIVVYDMEESQKLGDLIRQLARFGEPIAMATPGVQLGEQ